MAEQPSDRTAPAVVPQKPQMESFRLESPRRWPVSSWPYALLATYPTGVVLAVYRNGGLSGNWGATSADRVGAVIDGAINLGFYFLILWALTALARKLWSSKTFRARFLD